MEYSEKYGNSIEEAVELALKDLKATREDVEITVLEEPSKGFLGLGSKLAKVKVERKNSEPEERAPRTEAETVGAAAHQPEQSRPERESRRERAPKENISIAGNRPDDLTEVSEHVALDFLRDTTEKMGLSLSFRTHVNEESIYVDIEGKDAGTIIGKRGQTLDAIQYLTSLVVNKEDETYKRVVLDAENYRSKREKTLQQLADRLASKVARTRRPVRLEPMNPYERMVIHATLQDDDRVVTRSEGDEPYRRIIIEQNR